MEIDLSLAEVSDAPEMLALIHEAFSARPPVDPPAAALGDTVADVERAIAAGGGLLAHIEDELVGCLLLSLDGRVLGLHRVSVRPGSRQHGIAAEMVKGAARIGIDWGAARVELMARREFPQLIRWWGENGFVVDREVDNGYILTRLLPTRVLVPSADDMLALGRRIGEQLRPGDVILASGDLGAGKTTLAQGIGAGMGVEGPVISPTFVLSRVHPNPDGPPLVHVDAYRLATADELADIDLESSLASSVTLIEWGYGVAEWLSQERLEIDIERSQTPGDETREVLLTGFGQRWNKVLEGL